MKKINSLLVILVFSIGVVIFLNINKLDQRNIGVNYFEVNKLNAIETIETNYMTDEGLIRSYPITDNPEYLAESTGLYMELLLQQKDESRFRDQVDVLKKFFIVKVEDDLFIKWKIGSTISVNAFIDDLRIIRLLQQAASIFHQEDYWTLANDLTATITTYQIVNSQIPHYYDWDSKHQAPTMVNSYLHDDYLKILELDNQPSPTIDGLFFAEEQTIENGEPISSEEAHMVDQLLIATYCLGKSCENKQFDGWLKKQWEEKKLIYGRYNKENGMPTVKYESRAVYALAVRYFKETHPSIKNDIVKEKSSFFSIKADSKTHFFDYVHGVIVSNED